MNPTCCTCGVLERGLRKLAIAAMALAMAVRIAWIIALAAVVALFVAAAVTAEGAQAPAETTFTKDVLPILQRACQQCHRPGSVAPMSLLTYEDVRPWARAAPNSRPPGRRNALGLRLAWIHYRGPADVTFDPWTPPMEDHTPGWIPPELPEDGRIVTTVTFIEPGAYVLRGMADDGYLYSHADVTVTVTR